MNFDCARCLSSCHASCCGIVLLPTSTFDKHKHLLGEKVKVVKADDDFYLAFYPDGTCGFLNPKTKRCLIYDDRPEVCRLYGLGKELSLQCPYQNRFGKLRSTKSRRKIVNELNKKIKLGGKL
jgi:Fe-S-cluster containining protein